MTQRLVRLLLIASTVLPFALVLRAQDSARYYRVFFRDKGVAARFITEDDSLYATARSMINDRAYARRSRTLPADERLSTDDLPIPTRYVDGISDAGGIVLRTSRWMNSAMVLADTPSFNRIRLLSYVDSAVAVRPRRRSPDPLLKPATGTDNQISDSLLMLGLCVSERMGEATTQNRSIGLDEMLRLGFAGEGVLVGILDAGFDWRNHDALKNCRVVAEQDFVFGDSSTFDEGGEDGAESHGTQVMSLIAGGLDGSFIGGAPHASFVLAKTEDIRSEKHIEEDNFVAALEWMEGLGVDVTNTSLSYTTFDSPELPHDYSELDGHTAFASRAVNKAVRCGMNCVFAAGNDGAKAYRYIGVPAEADSAIAVAAVDSNGVIARFSSRGIPNPGRLKPDVAAMGVANRAANHRVADGYVGGQGTSYASPLVTAGIAVLLSARPDLRPWEVREILYATSSHATTPDTAYGHGIVDLPRALDLLSQSRPVVGAPRLLLTSEALEIYAFAQYRGNRRGSGVILRLTPLRGTPFDVSGDAALDGIATWRIPRRMFDQGIQAGDSVQLSFMWALDGTILRQWSAPVDNIRENLSGRAWDASRSTLCYETTAEPDAVLGSNPNPAIGTTSIAFQIGTRGPLKLLLYSATGEEALRVIDADDYPAGAHVIDVQTRGLAAGPYFYSIIHDDEIRTGKVILLGN